jgi:hypothetical protein
MNTPHRLLLAGLACLATLPPAAIAQTPGASPAQLEAGLVGRWSGHLEYRDYQNNQRFRIPVRSELRLASDGATLQRESRFDDGPARGTVLISTLGLFDSGGTRLTSASFRQGRSPELITELCQVLEQRSAEQWRMACTRRGPDGGQDSDIRVVTERSGARLTSVKSVRPAGAGDDAWVFRNETVLQREP